MLECLYILHVKLLYSNTEGMEPALFEYGFSHVCFKWIILNMNVDIVSPLCIS